MSNLKYNILGTLTILFATTIKRFIPEIFWNQLKFLEQAEENVFHRLESELWITISASYFLSFSHTSDFSFRIYSHYNLHHNYWSQNMPHL